MDPFRHNPEDFPQDEQDFQAECYKLLTQIGDTAWEIFSAIEDLPYWQPQARDLPEVERLHHEFTTFRNRLREFVPTIKDPIQ